MAEQTERTAGFYRAQAEQMLLRASHAHSEEMRARFLDLAAHWAHLAELSEKTSALQNSVAMGNNGGAKTGKAAPE